MFTYIIAKIKKESHFAKFLGFFFYRLIEKSEFSTIFLV